MSAASGATTITIVVDNRAGEGLLAEHGFSAWIEAAGRRLLFDTGQGGALEANANQLNIDLRATDTVVLSHGHWDHTGGVPLVTRRAPTVEIFAHPATTGPRYAIRHGSAKGIAMPKAARVALETHPVGVRWTTRSLHLTEGVGITGPIPRRTDYEDTGGPFFIDPEGARRDPLEDDLALWMRTERGLVVVVGCSHAGLVNTLQCAMEVSAAARLHAVLGGFHLVEAGEGRLARTMAALQELAPELVVPCHCTGDVAVKRLQATLGARVVPGTVGSVFRFGVVSAAASGHPASPPRR